MCSEQRHFSGLTHGFHIWPISILSTLVHCIRMVAALRSSSAGPLGPTLCEWHFWLHVLSFSYPYQPYSCSQFYVFDFHFHKIINFLTFRNWYIFIIQVKKIREADLILLDLLLGIVSILNSVGSTTVMKYHKIFVDSQWCNSSVTFLLSFDSEYGYMAFCLIIALLVFFVFVNINTSGGTQMDHTGEETGMQHTC